MIPCESFRGEPCTSSGSQPFRVVMSSAAAIFMDFHAHLSDNEVIGLLAGSWNPQERLLRSISPVSLTLDPSMASLTSLCPCFPVATISNQCKNSWESTTARNSNTPLVAGKQQDEMSSMCLCSFLLKFRVCQDICRVERAFPVQEQQSKEDLPTASMIPADEKAVRQKMSKNQPLR